MNLRRGEEVREFSRQGGACTLDVPSGGVREHYARMRTEGEQFRFGGPTAEGCMRVARTLARWREAEEAGLVRLLYVADCDPSSALDWLDQSAEDMGMSESRWKATGDAERERANTDGVYGLLGQYRTSEAEDWESGDSVWGFIGDDGLDVGGYAADVMGETLDNLDKAKADTCAHCGRPRVKA